MTQESFQQFNEKMRLLQKEHMNERRAVRTKHLGSPTDSTKPVTLQDVMGAISEKRPDFVFELSEGFNENEVLRVFTSREEFFTDKRKSFTVILKDEAFYLYYDVYANNGIARSNSADHIAESVVDSIDELTRHLHSQNA